MFSIKSVLCVIVGFFIGFLVSSYWIFGSSRSQVEVHQEVSEHYTGSDIAISSAELKVLIGDVVRTEIASQLSMYYDNGQLENITKATEANSKRFNDIEGNKRIELAYESAGKVLDDITSSGGFDADSAKEFIDHLNTLPHDKAMELRAKHMDAVNRGLISSPYPPEEFLKQE